jgi:hypothetical protein
MFELATNIIETKTGEFDPKKFEDQYEDAVKELLKKKQAGEKIESDDSEVIAATMAKPGVVLQRPVGSNKRFREHAELPTASSLEKHSLRFKDPGKEAKAPKTRKIDDRAERRAAAAFEKEERRRKLQR